MILQINPYLKMFAASARGQSIGARRRAAMLAMQHERATALGADYRLHFHALYKLLPRIVADEERIRELERKVGVHVAEVEAHRLATWDDAPLPEDAEIVAAFPTRTGRHELYAEAMRLVGGTRSKNKLVALVNWLLAKAAPPAARSSEGRCLCACFICTSKGDHHYTQCDHVPKALEEVRCWCGRKAVKRVTIRCERSRPLIPQEDKVEVGTPFCLDHGCEHCAPIPEGELGGPGVTTWHILQGGLPVCRFSTKVPRDWPAGHRWCRSEEVEKLDPADRLCTWCCKLLPMTHRASID